MNARSITPARRLLLAGLGYLSIFAGPYWSSAGPLAVLVGLVLYAALALLLLHAAFPMASRSRRGVEEEIHPVQAGKAPLLRRRNRLAWNQA